MTGSSFSYLVKHGFQSLWLNRLMTIASVGILTACLLITGGATLALASVRSVFKEVENQNQMNVYIDFDTSLDDTSTLQQQINAIDGVESTTYMSKEDALNDAREWMGEEGSLLDGLSATDDVIPAYFVVTLGDISLTDSVSKQISGFEHVYKVEASTYIADTLTGVERTLLILGGVIVAILILASIVVIANTIKLTVFARRKEINIMKYVGATNGFIRLPFVVEGLAIGMISALIAFFAVWAVYYSVGGLLSDSIVPWISSMAGGMLSFADVWYWLAGGFAVIGLGIGGFSSANSIRRYLKV